MVLNPVMLYLSNHIGDFKRTITQKEQNNATGSNKTRDDEATLECHATFQRCGRLDLSRHGRRYDACRLYLGWLGDGVNRSLLSDGHGQR